MVIFLAEGIVVEKRYPNRGRNVDFPEMIVLSHSFLSTMPSIGVFLTSGCSSRSFSRTFIGSELANLKVMKNVAPSG